MTPPLLSALILGSTLILFASERVRHDLVALISLFVCVALGLVAPRQAFSGFADPAVLAIAGILIVGRAVELSGIAGRIAQVVIPRRTGFAGRLATLLLVAALLSAFMNNIAALVITMPIASEIARDAKLPPAAALMPLSFATILGGMTTLIGTPANLILSTVREKELGEPFGFFTMAPVGVAVTIAGLLYLATIGWRLLPIRATARREARPPWRVFELSMPETGITVLPQRLRAAGSRLLAAFRDGQRTMSLLGGERLLILSRQNQWTIAERTGLVADAVEAPGKFTARVAVAHGSFLVGLGHEAIRLRSDGALAVVAVGPRAVKARIPLETLRIEAGDQLYIRGEPAALGTFLPRARLLEIDRLDRPRVAPVRALGTVAIFTAAVASIVIGGLPPALAFVLAAMVMAALNLIPTGEIYAAIDWSVIVLLAAMIPVGGSFETSGAADIAARWLGDVLAGYPLPIVLAALCGVTMLLSIFLNNVATAIIMGPLAIDAARLLGVSPDAALLAVLVGTSSDFLTPIGHQNNLLVMGPGGYRFSDYPRMGVLLVLIVIATTAITLSMRYG